MKQNRKKFILLAASGYFSFRLFLCGPVRPRCIAPVPGTRISPVSSDIFFVALCFCFGQARRRKEKITTPQARWARTPNTRGWKKRKRT